MLSEIGNALAPSQPIKYSEVNQASQASQANSLQSLRQALSDCMLKDRFRLGKRIAGAEKIKDISARNKVFDEIASDIAQSMMDVELRSHANVKLTIQMLPASQKKGISQKRLKKIKWSLSPEKLVQKRPNYLNMCGIRKE